jgi:hypothetical protein
MNEEVDCCWRKKSACDERASGGSPKILCAFRGFPTLRLVDEDSGDLFFQYRFVELLDIGFDECF